VKQLRGTFGIMCKESATFVLLLGTGWFIFLHDERKRYNYYYATAPPFGFPNCRQDGTVALERISAVWFQTNLFLAAARTSHSL
jgi:hypothetical protein